MSTIKDRNGKDLTEAGDIKKSWQEHTEKLYKKVLMIWITTMVWSLTYSQTYWSVKSSSGSITTNKASGGNGIPAEPFQILKDDAIKVMHSICQQIWKTQQWPQDWKRSVFIPMPRNVQTTMQLLSFHVLAR